VSKRDVFPPSVALRKHVSRTNPLRRVARETLRLMAERRVLAVHTQATGRPPERLLWVAGRRGVHRWRMGPTWDADTPVDYRLIPWERVGPVDLGITFAGPGLATWHVSVTIDGLALRHESEGSDGKVPTSLAFARACLEMAGRHC
jgi:hypothetical protein